MAVIYIAAMLTSLEGLIDFFSRNRLSK